MLVDCTRCSVGQHQPKSSVELLSAFSNVEVTTCAYGRRRKRGSRFAVQQFACTVTHTCYVAISR